MGRANHKKRHSRHKGAFYNRLQQLPCFGKRGVACFSSDVNIIHLFIVRNIDVFDLFIFVKCVVRLPDDIIFKSYLKI